MKVAELLRTNHAGVGEPEMRAPRFPADKLAKKMRRWAVTEKEFAELIAGVAEVFNKEASDRLGNSYPAGFTHPLGGLGADGGWAWLAQNKPDAEARLKRLEGFPKWDIEETYA